MNRVIITVAAMGLVMSVNGIARAEEQAGSPVKSTVKKTPTTLPVKAHTRFVICGQISVTPDQTGEPDRGATSDRETISSGVLAAPERDSQSTVAPNYYDEPLLLTYPAYVTTPTPRHHGKPAGSTVIQYGSAVDRSQRSDFTQDRSQREDFTQDRGGRSDFTRDRSQREDFTRDRSDREDFTQDRSEREDVRQGHTSAPQLPATPTDRRAASPRPAPTTTDHRPARAGM